MDYDVIVSCVESCGTFGIQKALLPAPLHSSIQATVVGYVRINLSQNSFLICRTYPVANSYCDEGYQVVAYNCVCMADSGTQRSGIKGNFKVTPKQLVPLKIIHPRKLIISVVFNSVEGVLKYRKNKDCFKSSLLDLIKLYGVADKCSIYCQNNPLARLLGISQIVIESSYTKPLEVCVADEQTEIVVSSVESEDRQQLMVKDSVNLGGLDAVLKYLRRIISEPWERRHQFEDVGVSYPSGVLLVGPPGCGKTSLVRQVCLETGASLVATAAVDVTSPYPGRSESNFAKVAERARSLSEEGPCILFIDEIDSLCPARTTNTPQAAITLTTQVLLEMDKCRQCPNLVLMAATNRPYNLDLAIRRSGRLEVEILLNVPSASDRCSILQMHTSGLLPPDHPSIEKVAYNTPGFVGADLQALVQATQMELATRKDNQISTDPDEIGRMLLDQTTQITPSIHKTLEFITSRPKSTVDVGGLNAVKQELEQIFEQHTKFAGAYKALKLRRPKGVLLYGPRGCGKTRLVASLAANRGCTFLSANASHLLSPYVGESEKRIAALFHAARLAQPTILFIDEIDGIFGRRDGGASGTGVSLLNELLQAMDGADQGTTSVQGATLLSSTTAVTQDGVLVCAATNHPRRLDPALLRPGRFDRLVYIPLPDYEARLDILKVKTKRMELESSDILKELAGRTEGFTGAELEGLVLKSVKKAILNKQYNPNTLVPCLHRSYLLSANPLRTPATSRQEIQAYKDFQCSVGGYGTRAVAS